MSIQAPESLACPLCGRPLDAAISQLGRDLEPRIVRILRSEHPAWARTDGACPECVQTAVQRAHRERSEASLHAELLLPFPVYARDDAHLIPTPLRVHANPRFTGRGVTIAFLDSGFYPHPDLTRPRNRILCYVDATDSVPAEKERFKQRRGSSWHGLMTSCVAAGSGFMSGGQYRGIASGANLVLVKTGNRRRRGIRDRDIARALSWVIDSQQRYRIGVINISLGGDRPSEGGLTHLDALVEDAVARGMVVVAAAGNDGAGHVFPPASAPSAITVGGLDDQNSLDPHFRRMWRSSYGRGVNGAPKPEVIAPAIWLAAPMLPKTQMHNEALFLWRLERAPDLELSQFLATKHAEVRFKKETLRKPLGEIRRIIRRRIVEQKYIHPHYQHVDGTSMAAPIVTSVVAQMLEANPSLSPAQIKQHIMATAEPLRYVPREEQGHGVVSAARAVAAALRAPGGAMAGLPCSPHVTPQTVTFYCRADDAREVALVGSFNGWQPRKGQMHMARRGVWQITLPLPPAGVHAYKFLLDRSRWVNDQENPARIEDGYGGFHSLLIVE